MEFLHFYRIGNYGHNTRLFNNLTSGHRQYNQTPSEKCSEPLSPSLSSFDTILICSDSMNGQTEDQIEAVKLQAELATIDASVVADSSKALLSPIRFSPQPGTSCPQPVDSELIYIPTPESSKDDDTISRYVFHPPKNPFDRARHMFECQRNVPRRRLSYGEPFSTPKPRSLHKITGIPELRRMAAWKPGDNELENGRRSPWLDGTFKTSAIKPWYSEPVRNKNKFWHGAAQGEDIQEAVSNLKPYKCIT